MHTHILLLLTPLSLAVPIRMKLPPKKEDHLSITDALSHDHRHDPKNIRVRGRFDPMDSFKDNKLLKGNHRRDLPNMVYKDPVFLHDAASKHKMDTSFFDAGNRNLQKIPDEAVNRHLRVAPRWTIEE